MVTIRFIKNKNITIQNLLKYMNLYQHNHNIKNKCITNTQYLYSCIINNFPESNIKAIPVICVSNKYKATIMHMVLKIDENIIDPSYDINYISDVIYYEYGIDQIPDYPHFLKCSQDINNGHLCLSDVNYYYDQADYIEKLY